MYKLEGNFAALHPEYKMIHRRLLDKIDYQNETINIVDILTEEVSKFKLTRPDIKWEVNIVDKKTIFKGTENMWEAIIGNILSNFINARANNNGVNQIWLYDITTNELLLEGDIE